MMFKDSRKVIITPTSAFIFQFHGVPDEQKEQLAGKNVIVRRLVAVTDRKGVGIQSISVHQYKNKERRTLFERTEHPRHLAPEQEIGVEVTIGSVFIMLTVHNQSPEPIEFECFVESELKDSTN